MEPKNYVKEYQLKHSYISKEINYCYKNHRKNAWSIGKKEETFMSSLSMKARVELIPA